MPQIPTYLAQENVNGVALQKAPRGGFDTVDLAGPTNQLVKAGGMFLKAQEEARLADMKLDVESVFNQAKVDFAQREIELKRAGMNPDDYPGAVKQALTETVKDAQKRLKYPDSAGAFQHLMTPYAAGKLVGSLEDAEGIRNAQSSVAAAVLNVQDANTAVYGATPGEREAAFKRGLDRTQGLLRSKVWSAAKAEAETQQFLGQVDTASAERDSYEPDKLPGVIDNLTSATPTSYKNIPPARRLELGKQILDRVRIEQDREATKAEKAFKDGREIALSELHAKSDAGETPTPVLLQELENVRKQWRVGPEEYRATRNYLTKKPDEAPSDIETLRLFTIGANRAVPSVSEAQIIAANDLWRKTNGAQGLNTKDMAVLLDQVRTTNRANRAEGRTIEGEELSRADKMLRAALGIPDLANQYEGTQAKLYEQGLRDITAASKRLGNQNDPRAPRLTDYVQDTVVPKLLQARDGENSLSTNEIRKTIGSGLPVEQLAQENEAAFRAQTISKGQYEARKRELIRLKDAENLEDQQRANKEFNRGRQRGKRQG